MQTSPSSLGLAVIAAVCMHCDGCDKDGGKQGTAPPPSSSISSNTQDVCGSGGGQDEDAVSAPFFPRTVSGWCLDPHGDAKTFGEKGKLAINSLCDTALDGGCEEYKRMGVTRTVILHYVEGKGQGSVEVFLSQFAADGAYAISTARLVGEVDPTDPSMPRSIPVPGAGAVGALGTGKSYAWRGAYFLELTYSNDNQTPEQLKKSSDEILPKLASAIAEKLPDGPGVPESAKALPEKNRVPLGILFDPKAVLGMSNVGAGAVGYYKDGNKRWRVLSIAKADVEQAKDVFKSLHHAGFSAIPNLGDEAMHVVLHPGPSRPKLEYMIVRKGKNVLGVGDEELLLSSGGGAPPPTAKAGEIELTKDEKLAKLREL
jgi:hypothetical protein